MTHRADPDVITNGQSTDVRPWWRLHKFTWVVAFATSVVFVVAAMSPVFTEEFQFTIGDDDVVECGWPWVFATYHYIETPLFPHSAIAGDYPAWLDWSLWRLDVPYDTFRTVVLLVDLVAIGIMLLAVMVATEVWRRMRRKVSHLYLGDLLGVTALVAVGTGWWVSWEHNATMEQRASDGNMISAEESRYCGPAWIIRLTGYRWCPSILFCTDALSLNCSGQHFTNEAIAMKLQAFRRARFVYFSSKAPPEAFRALTQTDVKWFRCSDPTEESLALLKDVKTLSRLVVDIDNRAEVNFNFRTASDIKSMTALCIFSECDLNDPITIQGSLADLGRVPHLSEIELWGVHIGTLECTALAQLRHLETLNLYTTDITDACVRGLQSAPRLRNLFVSDACISDDSIGAMIDMRSLTNVGLSGTKITDRGVRRLRQSRADLDVTVGVDRPGASSLKSTGFKRLSD